MNDKKTNKYRCSCCGDIFVRESDKQWIKTICGNSGDKDGRLIIIKEQENEYKKRTNRNNR
jgi:hypothetical protein